MRKTRLLLLLTLLPVAPLLLAAELPFGREDVRDYVVGRLSEMAGRELTVEGDMQIDLAWEPTIRLEEVRVANADWAEAPHMLKLEALEITLDMRRLLRGEVRLPRLALIGPQLFLERADDGENNWILGGDGQTIVESAAAPGGQPGNLPQIDRLEVTRGELAYLNHADPALQWVRGHIDRAGGSLDAEGVDFATSGMLGNELFTIVLRAASLNDLRAGEAPNPVYLLATAGASRFMVEGTVVAPFELRGIDLALEAHGPGFDELPLVTGLPESPPFDLSARLVREADPWRLEDLNAAIGRSDMTGTLTVDLTGERPRITADFSAETLAVSELLAIVPEGEPATEPQPEADADGIDLSGLETLDAAIDFTAEELLFRHLRMEAVQASLSLQDGILTLSPMSAAVGGGRVSTRLSLHSDPLQASARFELDDVNLEQALVDLDLGEYRLGILDGSVAVELPPSPEATRPEDETIDPVVVLQRLRVEEGYVSYSEPEQDTRVVLALVAGPAIGSPSLLARGRFRGATVHADLIADPVTGLTAEGPYAIDGLIRVGNTEGEIHATILSPPDLEDLEVTFDLTGDFREIAQLTGASVPDLPELNADAVLHRSGPRWNARDLDIRLGASDLSGQVELDTSGERPSIEADLRSDTIDLASLRPEDTRDDGPLEIPDVLAEVDARLSYAAGEIITDGASIEDLVIATRLQDGRLRLGQLRLGYRQPEQETRLDLDLSAADGPGEDGLTGRAEGRFRGNPVDAQLSTDAWIDLGEEGPPGRWEIRITPGETDLTLSGDLGDLLSPQTLDLEVVAEGPSAAQLSDIVGVQLRDTPPYRLSTRLSRDGRRLVFEDIEGRVGESDLSGRIAADFANVPTDWDVQLASERLHFNDLMSVIREQDAEETPEQERETLFPDRPLGLERMAERLQGRLRYSAGQVIAGEIPLDDLNLDANLRKGRLALSPLHFGFGGGSVSLNLDMDTTAVPPAADLEGEIRRVDLRRVLAPFELADETVGTVGGQIKVWMSGDSIADLAGSADGGLFLLMTGGALDNLLVALAGLDAGRALLALINQEKVPIDCAYLDLQSRDGQVDIETLVVDTTEALILGDGAIDLARERLELVIEASPKGPSLPTFGAPLRLEGPLTDVELQVVSPQLLARGAAAAALAAIATPLAGLIPLIEPGTGEDSPYCSGLMEGLKEAQR
jgi:uncharacterized protein involved in outer membrane biogenesis